MKIVTPNIHFNGTCEEAIAFYAKAFGAVTKVLLRYEDADVRDYNIPLTDAQKKRIYHAEIMIDNQRIMLSDTIDMDTIRSTSFFLIVSFDSAEEVMRAYEALLDGGTVIDPPKSTTYSSCFATLIDKFGLRWGLMTEEA